MQIGLYSSSGRPLLLALGLSLLLHGLLALFAPSVDRTRLAIDTPTLEVVLIVEPRTARRLVSRKTIPSPPPVPLVPSPPPVPLVPSPLLAVDAASRVNAGAAPDAHGQPAADPVPAPDRTARNEALASIERRDEVESVFDQALTAYRALLETALARQHHYPRLAQVRRWQGEAQVKLQVARDGHLLDARIIASSGHEILDQQALYTVRRTAPMPPFPGALGEPSITIIVPIRFVLAGRS